MQGAPKSAAKKAPNAGIAFFFFGGSASASSVVALASIGVQAQPMTKDRRRKAF
ncbi:MAG: hypothetical protein CM1200mP20_09390 [Pseudomonadota bacterium]|nr:MAG: hypothetical protein CM1200mP20_09390 [Pseudomonadota bacterium]